MVAGPGFSSQPDGMQIYSWGYGCAPGFLPTYAPAALAQILHYSWPGNIRELAHAIARACTVAAGPLIEVEDLPSCVQHADVSTSPAVVARPDPQYD